MIRPREALGLAAAATRITERHHDQPDRSLTSQLMNWTSRVPVNRSECSPLRLHAYMPKRRASMRRKSILFRLFRQMDLMNREAIKSVGAAARNEILEIFPKLAEEGYEAVAAGSLPRADPAAAWLSDISRTRRFWYIKRN